ncbi:hypothetical protein CWI38_0015p0080 [Hamiltosporidium tvaerminnensis]|uniref:Uncharacterized protein n=1 Tax=Hamiltosporidium tvaerminnensis TaxID=1176355 RepID=A0A4Q9M284_9MICR|nr:hypothetical protein CWI38_0015p0080 [Hamiltosporidium tvaerminnensis]
MGKNKKKSKKICSAEIEENFANLLSNNESSSETFNDNYETASNNINLSLESSESFEVFDTEVTTKFSRNDDDLVLKPEGKLRLVEKKDNIQIYSINRSLFDLNDFRPHNNKIKKIKSRKKYDFSCLDKHNNLFKKLGSLKYDFEFNLNETYKSSNIDTNNLNINNTCENFETTTEKKCINRPKTFQFYKKNKNKHI